VSACAETVEIAVTPSGSKQRLPSPSRNIGLIFLILFCWAVASIPQLAKYFHDLRLFLVFLTGALCIVVLVASLRWLLAKQTDRISTMAFVTFWSVMVILYLFLYPLSQRHAVGSGSDAEDALRVAATQLMQFHYPYYGRTFAGNPITPLPGAVLLAVPFQAVHRIGLQNIFWLAGFICFCAGFFRRRATALAFLIVMTFAALVSLDHFVVGGDYTVNLWYVCVASYLFVKAYDGNHRAWAGIAAGVLLGVTLSSRAVYPLVFIPLLTAYVRQHRSLLGAGLIMLNPLLVATVITVPFYFYDRAHFSPLHIAQKLNFLPPRQADMALILLTWVAISVACSGYFVRLTLARLFLIAGIASSSILLTPGILLLFSDQSQERGLGVLSYANVPATLIALWAFYQLEAAVKCEPPLDQTPLVA
jgi:hypothetical protein